jgi:hypothetical protein
MLSELVVLNQLKLGSTLGAEEQRQYQQAARAAQTARGNIFGVAPDLENNTLVIRELIDKDYSC